MPASKMTEEERDEKRRKYHEVLETYKLRLQDAERATVEMGKPTGRTAQDLETQAHLLAQRELGYGLSDLDKMNVGLPRVPKGMGKGMTKPPKFTLY